LGGEGEILSLAKDERMKYTTVAMFFQTGEEEANENNLSHRPGIFSTLMKLHYTYVANRLCNNRKSF
jgi:hypothetical protein